ncbi:hypothetical protein C8R45DRAFT_934138 [Mycena sanguinolenta]|nr:hypothetical protein C8R45DRAFT_934138 [Mycena sanguinolenta]
MLKCRAISANPAGCTRGDESRKKMSDAGPKAGSGPHVGSAWARLAEPKSRGFAASGPGRNITTWVHGTKKVFFERRKAEWIRESEKKNAGPFYTKMAKLFIKKYGRHIQDDQDLTEDVDDPPDDAADEVVHEVLTPEEQQFRTEHLKALRTRIGAWYRLEYGALLKTEETAFKELFTGALDNAPLKPQRRRTNHFYSRKFYETRIKVHVEERMESLIRRAQLSGEEPPKLIDIVAKVTAERWDQETPEFRLECEIAKDREHEQAMDAYRASLADSPSQTPEERAAFLANSACYLKPFVDAIEDRFGMCATLLLAGPIGIRGGRIGVQSVHSGITKGISPVDWPTYDWAGFQKVENSMIAFAWECFCAIIRKTVQW